MNCIKIIFLVLFFKNCTADAECDKKWPRCGEIENIVCQKGGTCDPAPDSGCEPLKNDNSFRNWIVAVHNEYRFKLASGKDGLHGIGPVANMRVLNYDFDLEYTASCRANSCSQERDKCARTERFLQNGQNIEIVDGGEEAISDIPHQWYKRTAINKEIGFDRFQANTALSSQFTQMVWANTTHIGCAKAFLRKANKTILVCNYGPPGNILIQPVIEKGTPASNCPPDQPKSSEYNTLCGQVFRLSDLQVEKSGGGIAVKIIQLSYNILGVVFVTYLFF